MLTEYLREPELRELELDSAECSLAHRRILERKTILRRLFEDLYRRCMDADLRHFQDCPALRLEIGSGTSLIKQTFGDVITSDLRPLPWLDLMLDAQALPILRGSLRAIYAINTFHHIPDPRRFFREALRVLRPGGGIVLIECYHGLFARWLLPGLHAGDDFTPQAPEWKLTSTGAMSGGNTALSYIIFTRDRTKFELEFPQFEIVEDHIHTPLWYYASGGVNFRQLVPDALTDLVHIAERALTPFNRWLAFLRTIVLRKRP